MEKEVWKFIVGYEGKYMVSSYGRVKSLNYNKTGKEKLMSPVPDKDGYLRVILWFNGKRKLEGVHRLVAFAFPEICGKWFEGAVCNHKDENPSNNRADNLEWVTQQYNIVYGTARQRQSDTMLSRHYKRSEETKHLISESKKKPIIQYDKNMQVIAEWENADVAGKSLDYKPNTIRSCANGKNKTAYGFIWRYAA